MVVGGESSWMGPCKIYIYIVCVCARVCVVCGGGSSWMGLYTARIGVWVGWVGGYRCRNIGVSGAEGAEWRVRGGVDTRVGVG